MKLQVRKKERKNLIKKDETTSKNQRKKY